MMAQFKYIEITTRSGNTKVCVFRKVKTMSPYKKWWIFQKILGVTLIIACIVGCYIMPEDCGGFFVGGLMGIVRVVCE